MENTQPNPNTNGDVDLTLLFKMIGRGFYNFGNSLLLAIATLRSLFVNNLKFFMATIIIGLSLGTLYSKLLKTKYYRSSMVLNCSIFNNQIMETHINELTLLCNDPNRKELARVLGVSDSLAKQILGFQFEPFVSENDVIEVEVLKEQLNANVAEEKKELIEKIITRIDIENKDAFRISVLVKNPAIVASLEQPIVDYFQNNAYIKRRLELNRLIRNERRSKLIRESQKLDSLKKVIYNNLGMSSKTDRGSNNVILNDKQIDNPLDVFREDLALNTQILQLESELFLHPDFELIDGFTAFTKPESPGMIKVLLISLFSSFLVGYLVLFAWRFDRMLAKLPVR